MPFITTGRGGRFGDDDNAVNMVGHDDECIQYHIRVVIGYGHPAGVGNVPDRAVTHDAVYDLAEDAGAIVYA